MILVEKKNMMKFDKKNIKGLTLIEILFVCVFMVFIFLMVSKIFNKTVKDVVYERESVKLKQSTELMLFLASAELQEAVKIHQDSVAGLTSPEGTNVLRFVKYDPNGSGKGIPGALKIEYSLEQAPEGDYNFRRIDWSDPNNPHSSFLGKNIPSRNDLNFKYVPIGEGKEMIKITLTCKSASLGPPYTVSNIVALRRRYPTITQKNPSFDKDILKGGF